MRVGSGLILCILVLATMQAKPKTKQVLQVDKQTVITFVIQEQESHHNQILKLTLEITKRDASLVDALESANELRQELTNIFESFCQRFNETCDDDIETSTYKIEAEYYHLRGEQSFKTFVVKFEMDFMIDNFEAVGLLLDDFEEKIIDNHIVIRGIEWQDISDEMTLEEIIDEGLERAKKSCESLGMTYFKIKSIEQVEQENEEQEQPPKKQEDEEQEDQEEQEEEEEQPTTQQDDSQKYKFVAVCRSYKAKPKKSQLTKILVSSKNKKIKQFE